MNWLRSFISQFSYLKIDWNTSFDQLLTLKGIWRWSFAAFLANMYQNRTFTFHMDKHYYKDTNYQTIQLQTQK